MLQCSINKCRTVSQWELFKLLSFTLFSWIHIHSVMQFGVYVTYKDHSGIVFLPLLGLSIYFVSFWWAFHDTIPTFNNSMYQCNKHASYATATCNLPSRYSFDSGWSRFSLYLSLTHTHTHKVVTMAVSPNTILLIYEMCTSDHICCQNFKLCYMVT